MIIDRNKVLRVKRRIIKWSHSNKRDFPWRDSDTTPFVVFVSEMLLRKTNAYSVEKILGVVLTRYPDFGSFSRASYRELSRLLEPLGLHRIRARALIETSKTIASVFNNKVPETGAELRSLPHVGRYIANAVLCFAFNKRFEIVDANIVRLFSRVYELAVPREVHKAEPYWVLARQHLPRFGWKEFNWAMLDLGSVVCKPRNPLCEECPLTSDCNFYSANVKG